MRRQVIGAIVLSMLLAAVSHAQVIYEPVQSQYRTNNGVYYYGGTNPRVLEYIYQYDCFSNRDPRAGAYGIGYLHPKLIGRPPLRRHDLRALGRIGGDHGATQHRSL